MRQPDLRLKPVLRKGRLHARDEIAAIRLVVGVLELATAALREVAARRLLVMRTEGERAVIENGISGHAERHVTATWRHAVTSGRDPDDRFVHSTSASARGIASARSSAIICGPAISAARPWSHTAAQAASNAGRPRARIAAVSPASTSPVPALASHAGAGGRKPRRPSGEATSVSAPLQTTTAPDLRA